MRVAITHTTRVEYGHPVTTGVMDIRLGPLSDDDQRWDRFELRVTPFATMRPYQDAYGNTAHLITIAEAHDFLEVVTRSEVATLQFNTDAPTERPPVPVSATDRFDFLAPSALVPLTAELIALAMPFQAAREEENFAAVRAMSSAIYEQFEYRQETTTVSTTVPEVLRARTGVCQDFAHVLAGMCRSIHIPARYVSGYLISDADPSVRDAQASAASHAWVEAWTPTHGWRGFDPTNNHLAGQHHVKMAVGRDYNDVRPTRGTARGASAGKLLVAVETRRLD